MPTGSPPTGWLGRAPPSLHRRPRRLGRSPAPTAAIRSWHECSTPPRRRSTTETRPSRRARYTLAALAGVAVASLAWMAPAQASARSPHAPNTRDHLMIYSDSRGLSVGIEATAAESPTYRKPAIEYLTTVLGSTAPRATTKDATHDVLPSNQDLAQVLSDLQGTNVVAATDPVAGWPIKGGVTDSSGLNWKMTEYN